MAQEIATLAGGSFALTFAQQMTSFEMSDFAVRFQAINPTINGSSSGVGLGSLSSSSVSAAPDPATWMTMLVGFWLFGLALRRSSFAPRDAARV